MRELVRHVESQTTAVSLPVVLADRFDEEVETLVFEREIRGGIAERFLIGLEEARKGARLGRAFLWLLLGWACAWIQILIYLRMFGAEGSFAVSVFCLGVIALGGAVPSSPGAVGVYELAGVAALTFLGYSREVALGVVVTAHLVQYSLTVILGAAALSREGRSLGDLARAARGLVLRPAA